MNAKKLFSKVLTILVIVVVIITMVFVNNKAFDRGKEEVVTKLMCMGDIVSVQVGIPRGVEGYVFEVRQSGDLLLTTHDGHLVILTNLSYGAANFDFGERWEDDYDFPYHARLVFVSGDTYFFCITKIN